MKYQEIPGWFDFGNIYEDATIKSCGVITRNLIHEFIVNKEKNLARNTIAFVEIGCFMGKSTRYLLDVMGKWDSQKYHLHCVDIWEWSEWYANHMPHLKAQFPNQLDGFKHFVGDKPSNVELHLYKMPSLEAAKLFADGSVDFAFIDASHAYEDVRDDIKAWWPKIVDGGTLAGHDYYDQHCSQETGQRVLTFAGVAKAVGDFFVDGEYIVNKSSWIAHKNGINFNIV